MEESRVFSLNGVSLETVVKSVETFLRDEKGMEIQSAPVEHGCVIQATQKKDTLKMLVGMRLATTVQLVVSGENLNVVIGEGQWADKLGAGAVGLFLGDKDGRIVVSLDHVLRQLGEAVAVLGQEAVEIYLGLRMPVRRVARPFAGEADDLAEHHI